MWYLCTRRPPPPPTPGWPRTPGRWWTLPATRQTRWQRPAGREPRRNLQTQTDADTDGSSHPEGEAAVSRKADRPGRCRGIKEKKTPTKPWLSSELRVQVWLQRALKQTTLLKRHQVKDATGVIFSLQTVGMVKPCPFMLEILYSLDQTHPREHKPQ